MICKFCKNEFKTISSLNNHQRTAKYCLEIQGVKSLKTFECECGSVFTLRSTLKKHLGRCTYNTPIVKKLKEEIALLKNTNKELKNTIKELRNDKRQIQARYDKLSLTAVKRPTTISNKTMNINNFIKNMQPLKVQDIESSVPLLTLEHHSKGAEGYAEFALEFPFKDKIVCVDVSRNKIKYKNDDGDIIEDVGFRKMMVKLCKSLKDRSFNLSLEHEYKLSDTWTEKELESVDFMEAAVAIAKYAQGRENEFCNKIIKLISKGSTSPL